MAHDFNLLLVVIFHGVDHVSLAVSLHLQHFEILDGISSGTISLGDPMLNTNITVSEPIDIHLDLCVYLVLVTVRLNQSSHLANLFVLNGELLLQITLVSVDAVQLLKNQIEAPLQRSVIREQLIQIII